MDFRGFDSSIILILRGGILMSIGIFPESLSQANVSKDNVSREIGRTCMLHIILYIICIYIYIYRCIYIYIYIYIYIVHIDGVLSVL